MHRVTVRKQLGLSSRVRPTVLGSTPLILHGDCLEVMAGLEPESVDAVVTDPPYDLVTGRALQMGPMKPEHAESAARRSGKGFMGKAWDGTGIAFRPETWAAAFRVAKPSSYLLAFGGTRTVHRMTVAIEDAGWIIRDMLVWAYASGFPKSKASLKPAWEPIVMARKPGPLRMLAIDECRIPFAGAADEEFMSSRIAAWSGQVGWDGPAAINVGQRRAPGATSLQPQPQLQPHADGRWPANVLLTDPIFDGGIEGVVGGGETTSGKMMPTVVASGERTVFGQDAEAGYTTIETYGDSGTYSRFFLIPKADRSDREPILGGLPDRAAGSLNMRTDAHSERTGNLTRARANVHPTVKPTDLMRHLVRLVTPSGGTVLDPFLGSGTTGLACELEGFPWIGIEREAEYVAIAEARLNGTQRGLGLAG